LTLPAFFPKNDYTVVPIGGKKKKSPPLKGFGM
jgi:hypothetical protein